jgi:methyltransferase (TIGR00027 family)
VKDGRASATAQHNALFRAMESTASLQDQRELDPFARRFLTPPLRQVAAIARTSLGYRLITHVVDRRWPGVRTSVVARTSLIDGLLEAILEPTGDGHEGAAAATGGVQVVLLGAGFDSRAHRLSCLRRVQVFEVDHPATQARKRYLLERVAGVRSDVRYVASDFRLGRLGSALVAAGYDEDVRSVFLWEGVTNYLSEEAVDETLRWCASTAGATDLVFTYVDRTVLSEPDRYHGAARTLATSRRVGEEVTFGLPPEELGAYLADRGLALISDIGAADYRRTHYGAAADAIRGHEFYRVAHARMARVGDRAPSPT